VNTNLKIVQSSDGQILLASSIVHIMTVCCQHKYLQIITHPSPV